MSLKESWQQQRQQRQQEVVQRQQRVQQALETVRQERQIKAAQLRDELSLFRDAIASDDQARRAQFQQFQAGLQEFCGQLQNQVQRFLEVASDRRQIQAKELALQLNAFVQQIQQEMAQFLSETTADRVLMAQQLETELTAFVQALRTEVHSYLEQVEAIRKNRAEQLQQELAQSRLDREAEVEVMFQRFATFRSELRQFRDTLSNQVWGSATASTPQPLSTKEPTAKLVSPPASKPPASVPSIPVPTRIGAFQHGDSIAVLPAKPVKPPVNEGIAYEKEVYNFIHDAHGARLTQIEASLGINRFQAVDALRALIKKGLITQRDRIYLTQEQIA